MSHTVKIEVKFKTSELPQLEKAFKKLGWKIQQNTKARTYQGTTNSWNTVAVNPGTAAQDYDIGIVPNKGEVELFTDFYGGSVERTLGSKIGKLKQEFAAAVIEDEYPNATINRTVDNKGNLIIEVEQWA